MSNPHELWLRDNGDSVLRLDYPLDSNSVVVDAGGYEGSWAYEIYSRYNCSMHIFEPIKSYFDNIQHRFSFDDKIKVHNCGISDKNCEAEISINGDSSSTFRQFENSEKIELIDFSEFILKNNLDIINLMKINIEGGEYALLDSLIKNRLIDRILNVQVQFHSFVDNAVALREDIRRRLSETHELTYDYEFIWENWRKKS